VPAPASGDATKFLRGDGSFVTIPGGGDLLSSNNLSDVANAATARSNLQALGSAATGQSFTGGVNPTEYDNGTKSTGSYTPEPGNGPLQKVTNNGAHTLIASSNVGSFVLRVINGASAGAITFSGFDKQLPGDTYATTNANQYDIFIKITGKKTYQIVALQ
jgi:hypothetical protein